MEKKRPETISLVEIKVNHVKDLLNDSALQEKFVHCFNSHGFVIITPNELSDNLVSLQPLFGTLHKHEKMNSEGILVIDPIMGFSPGQKNTEMDHLPHTDECYLNEASRIMILQCVIQSSIGGESTIVYGSEMFEFCKENFTQDEIELLFRNDCLNVGRTLSNSTQKDCSTISIFNVNERNCLEVKWRSMDSYVNNVNESVLRVYEKLNSFVCDPSNQLKFKLKPNQILVVDNRGLCHGRIRYPSEERRTLWRTNYMNDGILSSVLINGFKELIERTLASSYGQFALK
jgi:alpha-ketoglutarate-dependent taurine dioxygenase